MDTSEKQARQIVSRHVWDQAHGPDTVGNTEELISAIAEALRKAERRGEDMRRSTEIATTLPPGTNIFGF